MAQKATKQDIIILFMAGHATRDALGRFCMFRPASE